MHLYSCVSDVVVVYLRIPSKEMCMIPRKRRVITGNQSSGEEKGLF